MDKDTRNRIQRATQAARALLEREYGEQLDGVYDIRLDGTIAAEPGSHLDAGQRVLRTKLVAAVEHHRASGMGDADAVAAYLRELSFTTLNRFAALKMLEARELVQECVSRGEQSAGFKEFVGLAPGMVQLEDHGYRLYLESLFDEIGCEIRVLFDRRSPTGVLWPRRQALGELLAILNAPELATIWEEDETIGWLYQYFNSDDERRKMRDESQAPRNSRELAVRNQFFTPRYVVQFLTDNTLGRIWYEMQGAKTGLAERCEYLVRKPDEEFAPRAKKDPRDLRVLDPACGSGHFLLYAFDLLLAIYEEAHADPESPKSEVSQRTLAADYPSLEALRKAAPRLILANNLHGVDIDPRCAQIAQLALWMRAQRAYRDFDISRAERPQIRRSNIVVAEPLVADEQLAEEFVARLGDAELGRVFKGLIDTLKLAGDMGLLLKVENLVSSSLKKGETGNLFAPPEQRIRAALARFAEEESTRANTRRRLFADDAAQGMGLLEVAEKKYDVVLMNPPFGAGSTRSKKEFEKAYPRTKNDVYAAFVERGIELLYTRGRLGAITSRTGFFLSSFQKWREEILLNQAPPNVVADLGSGVLDAAAVETSAYCVQKGMKNDTLFVRLIESENKGAALQREVQESTEACSYRLSPTEFLDIPGSPFAYWTTFGVRKLFRVMPQLESSGVMVRVSNESGDDFRFMRLAWETPIEPGRYPWTSHAKGGTQSDYYHDIHLTVQWEYRRRTVRGYIGRPNRPDEALANADLFLRPGLTYPRRTNGLSIRVLPRNATFSNKGPAILHEADDEDTLLAMCSLVNSASFRGLVALQLARTELAQSFEVGLIRGTPVPLLQRQSQDRLAAYGRQAWSLKRSLDTLNETSHAFTLPALLQVSGDELAARAVVWSERVRGVQVELAEIQAEIDERCFELYGLDEADRRAITAGFGAPAPNSDEIPPAPFAKGGGSSTKLGPTDEDADLDDEGESAVDAAGLTAELVSWAVGAAFKRFDVRLATGERDAPPEPDPFEPLPVCSPGMLTDEAGLPLGGKAMLVDDRGHESDLTSAVRSVFDTVFGKLSDDHWREAAVLLNGKDDLQPWLARSFFEHHIKRYSKSRRKAPVYWQLATPSSSYSVWLYIHAFTKDTLFRVLNDYVSSKVTHEERKLAGMTQAVGGSPTAGQRKEISVQESFVEELRSFRDEVSRVAPLWNPDLDDGVIINFAPLWRLLPQHKPWQKECKACFDALCDGKYDWAHLAMHLWPERVVPKCVDDRSLAIAHGLESVFWAEGDDGKWSKRAVDGATIQQLIADRTSLAVKDALKSLLEAPAPSTGRGGGRKAKTPRRTSAPKRESAASDAVVAISSDTVDRVREVIAGVADGVSKADVLAATGISDGQWNVAINALLAQGIVIKTGERRGARYHLVGGKNA